MTQLDISEFDLLENAKGDFVLSIDEREGDVKNPSMLIEKDGRVILIRNTLDQPCLTAMTEILAHKILAKKSLLVVEVSKGEFCREYVVEIICK